MSNELTHRPASDTVLDTVLGIPEHLAEQDRYVGFYYEMTDRLKEESNGLPMTTLMEVLIERIASTYVTIRWREDTNSWNGVSQQKELNTYFLELTKEFSRQLREGDDELREAMLIKLHEIVIDSLQIVDDRDLKQKLRQYFAEKFRELGL